MKLRDELVKMVKAAEVVATTKEERERLVRVRKQLPK